MRLLCIIQSAILEGADFRGWRTERSIRTYHETDNSLGQHNINNHSGAAFQELGSKDALVEKKDRDLIVTMTNIKRIELIATACKELSIISDPSICIWVTSFNVFLSSCERITVE